MEDCQLFDVHMGLLYLFPNASYLEELRCNHKSNHFKRNSSKYN